MKSEGRRQAPLDPTDLEGQVTTGLPVFGSDEHLVWLAKRLLKNIRFRQEQNAFAELGLDAHRRTARELAS